ncbi:MAG TPA: CHRD domain-containing protein [Opitutaceae bacterium]|nr:CHRD domain-containing protein [Opitutaceae bacterium]
MKTRFLPRFLFAGALFAVVTSLQAQIVEFRAVINGSQETPANPSTAVGSAVLLYNVATNTFDLTLTINSFANTITASHIHEGPIGVAGGIVTNFGSESVYTRSGNTITGTFRGVTHGGTKLTLLQNGAYLNFHTAAFPGGEVRGQLIAQPKRLIANMTVAQEQAAFPATPITSNAGGGAVMVYDPGTNRINLRISLYNWTNTMTASHYHEAAVGVSGPVVTNLGAGTVANYTISGTNVTGTFLNLAYTGDPIKLLTGGAYLNFHSNIYGTGETRGQVVASDEVLSSRMGVLSTRGFVGTGNQVLIAGLNIPGPEPMRVLITAKGPSLTAFGVTGALTDPRLTLHDGAGRQIAENDNYATGTSSAEIISLGSAPTSAAEAAIVAILPPGNYTAVVSGVAGATGIALVEAIDMRSSFTLGSGLAFAAPVKINSSDLNRPSPLKSARPAPEFCVAPLATVATSR